MNRRIRFLAALLALFAFTAYFGENAWASMCPPGMEMPGTHAGAAAGEIPQSGTHHAPLPAGDPDGAPTDSHGCPLGMAAGGSCVTVSLPASVQSMRAAAPHSAGAPRFVGVTHDRLQVSAHFRPPIA